ncbi:MAG: DUF3649 domain-containing protein [Paucibacter sp.]|nr:DUF3649 domain-containing protein [Roseateles sp.]
MWRYRMVVASRALAALGGGYLLAAAVAAASADYLPLWPGLPRAEATIGGVMLAFLVYAVAFMTAFACRTALRAWAYVLTPALVLGLAVMIQTGTLS